MSVEDEHAMNPKTDTKTKKVKTKLPRSKKTRVPFVPNATKSAARIKASLSARSKNKTQVGFD